MNKIIIAIDGHAASGKGTIAKQLAQALQYKYIDTGAMYRAITYFFLQNNIDLQVAEQILQALQDIHIDINYNTKTFNNEVFLNGKKLDKELRTQYINQSISQIASIKSVREFALVRQQLMGIEKCIVMDGRDIGTKIFPQAEVKFFITADINIRAQRRYKEMQQNGMTETYENVYKNLLERDNIDTTRQIAPLQKAIDAIEIDNTNLSVEAQFVQCLDIAKRKIYSNV